jgi:hypothetical protein
VILEIEEIHDTAVVASITPTTCVYESESNLSESDKDKKPTRLAGSGFQPTQEDTLFWSMFVAREGWAAYHGIGHKYKNRELDEKRRIVTYFQANPQLRPPKMSMVRFKELLGEIATDQRITLRTLPLLCTFYGITVHVLHATNRTYVTYRPTQAQGQDASADVAYLQYDDRRRQAAFSVLDAPTSDLLASRVLIDAYDKPFQSVSHYKVQELRDLAARLGKSNLGIAPLPSVGGNCCAMGSGGELVKKNDLYQALYHHCAWKM